MLREGELQQQLVCTQLAYDVATHALRFEAVV